CASLAAAAAGGGSLLCLPHHASHIAPPPSPRPHNASTVGTPIATPLSSASPPTAAPARPHLRRRRHYPLFAALPSLRCAASLPGVPIPSSPRHFPICRPACLPPRRPHPFLATSLPHSPPPLHASRRNPAAESTGELTAVPAGRRQSPSPRRSALHCRGISPPNGRRSRSTPPSSHADSMSNPYLTTVSTCGSS
ncbi:hypothetical protein EE612_040224, partial [Oryza sativa]